MDNKIRTLPKIENKCQLAKRITKRFLKSLNDEIFDDFMEQAKDNGYYNMRKENEEK